MALSTLRALRVGQAGICFLVMVFAILVCCTTPTSRRLNFYTNVDSIGMGMDIIGADNPLFQGLILGIRGFCSENGCATYDYYAANPTQVNDGVRLAGGELDAVALLAGQIGDLGQSPLHALNILTGVAAAASGLAFGASVLSAGLARKPVHLTFLGTLLVTLVFNVSTWAYALHIFLKAEKKIAKDIDYGKFGPAFYLSLFTWVLLLLVAAIEPFAFRQARKEAERYENIEEPIDN